MRDHMGYADWKRFEAKRAMKPVALAWACVAVFAVAVLLAGLMVKASGGTP
jgi:hypothetical protein